MERVVPLHPVGGSLRGLGSPTVALRLSSGPCSRSGEDEGVGLLADSRGVKTDTVQSRS